MLRHKHDPKHIEVIAPDVMNSVFYRFFYSFGDHSKHKVYFHVLFQTKFQVQENRSFEWTST